MGIKSDTKSVSKSTTPTAEQLRISQLTALPEGSSDEWPNNIQKLIKRVIETTRCSQSQAELALFDHDNNLEEAVNYIIENQNNTDSWTEPKKKGDKKKEDEVPVGRYRRGEANGGAGLTGRGRGGAKIGTRGRGGDRERSDRPPRADRPMTNGDGNAPHSFHNEKVIHTGGSGRGEGRGGGRGRGASSSNFRGRGGNRGGEHNSGGGYQAGRKDKENDDLSTPFKDDYNDWKSGPKVFNRTEETSSAVTTDPTASSSLSLSATASASAQPSISATATNPTSFAAVAAAAHRKEELRKLQAQQPRRSSPPPSVLTPSTAANIQLTPTKDSAFDDGALQSTPSGKKDTPKKDAFGDQSSLHTAESIDAPSILSANSGASPGLQANSALTHQLKSELGIGIGGQVVKESQATTSRLAPQPPTAGVEFVSEVEPSGNAGYSFGFSSEPPKDPPMASFNQPSTVQAASTQQKISATGQAPAPPLSPVGTQSQVSQPQQSAADALFGTANRKQNKLDDRSGLSNGDYSGGLKSGSGNTSVTGVSGVSSAPAPANTASSLPVHSNATPFGGSSSQQQQQQQSSAAQQQTGNGSSHTHRLDFTTHSSVSYAPQPPAQQERMSSQSKPSAIQQQQQQQQPLQQSTNTLQQAQQQQQQQQSSAPQPTMFPPPFTSIPAYPYMFSPVTGGIRDPSNPDPYTTAMLAGYPFSSIGMDLVNNFVNPTTNTQPQQQQHAGGAPHRNDSGPHLMDMNKYGTTAGLGTGREQHQQSGSSGVAPPPGFGNSYMQHNIGSLFMPTHPSAYSAPFPGLNMMSVMPPTAAGRQMYGTNNVMGAFAGIGGDDDRNKGAYDKNKQQAQATPPPYNSGLYNKKPPQPSPYQWQ